MPTQPDPQPLRVGSPTDLLAVVPHLLGFIPGRSLVIAGARVLPVGQAERGGVFAGERVHDVNGPIRRSRTGLVFGVSR